MDPLLKEIPTAIETNRLILRCPQPGDGQAMHKAIDESLDEFQKWFAWAHEMRTLENSESSVRQAQIRFLRREGLPFMVWHKEREGLIGRAGFVNIDWKIPSFEIGYWLRNSCVGHGYMTEAVSALTDLAFDTLDARRLEILCDTRNKKSAAIPIRLGSRSKLATKQIASMHVAKLSLIQWFLPSINESFEHFVSSGSISSYSAPCPKRTHGIVSRSIFKSREKDQFRTY